MHIPQGMAYGLLAGLDPVVGLYMAFFPALIYFIFGTSRHISVGTFAVVSIMTSKIVATYSDPDFGNNESQQNSTLDYEDEAITKSYSNYQVATAVTMVCGIFQIIMSFLKLGVLATLLSQSLVSGFTTAAAFHVIVAQSKDLFGIQVPRHKGAFKIIYTMRDVIMNIPNSNLYTLCISVACVSFMILMNEVVRPLAAKKCSFPLPSELMAVIGFTIISFALNLGGPNCKVIEVGKIPTGLPVPMMPPIELLQTVAVDSIAVCIVSYSIMISMALIFAKKDSYEVRANQELLATGFANIAGSFFSCIPLSCSLSRSIIQHKTGGKTQVASVVSALLILILILWIGPLFETLPRATLAGIIIVALKGMVFQIKDLKTFWNESALDAAVWILTFLTVVIIDIDIGLLVGIIVSFFVLYKKGYKIYSCMLGQVPNTDIYVDLQTNVNIAELPNIKIFRYYGSVNFATRNNFKQDLYDNIGVNQRTIRRASICKVPDEIVRLNNDIRKLIIDFSAISHIDMSGYRTLLEIKNEMKLLSVSIYLANPSSCVYDLFDRAHKLKEESFECFPTIHDAVLYSNGL
ncbi:hypothetical protein ACKWTF_007277 [Chironomus riparius]